MTFERNNSKFETRIKELQKAVCAVALEKEETFGK